MSISIADQYFIKALGGYPYDLEESIENLHYALSYNSQHAGALNLMAHLYMEQLEDYTKTEKYFQMAIGSNPTYFKAFYGYSCLMVMLKEFEKAQNLINYMYKIKGADMAMTMHVEAFLMESKKEFTASHSTFGKSKTRNLQQRIFKAIG